jgi:hypothetical protein
MSKIKRKFRNPVKVEIVESERGWGQKVESVREFGGIKSAQKFADKFNAPNIENHKKKPHYVPDCYVFARIVG